MVRAHVILYSQWEFITSLLLLLICDLGDALAKIKASTHFWILISSYVSCSAYNISSYVSCSAYNIQNRKHFF